MSIIPRDLADLENHYQSLVEGVSTGSLSYDDAIEALSHIAATDAVGIVWRLDISGNFLAAPAGVEPILTDPQRFVERTSPGPWETTSSYQNDQQSRGHYVDEPTNLNGNRTQGQSVYGSGEADVSHYAALPYGTQRNNNSNFPQGSNEDNKKRRIMKFPKIPNFNGGIVESLNRYRTFIFVGIAILGAVFIWSSSSPSTPTTELTIAEQTPSTEISPVEEEIPAAVEGDINTDKKANLLKKTNLLLEKLGTGNAESAPSVVGDPGQGNKALLRRAQFSGYANVGLSVRAVSIASSTASSATVKVTLISTTGEILAKGTVEIIRDSDGWILKSWPVLG